MKKFVLLFCLVLSLLLIGESLKIANQTRELAAVVVDGEVVFTLSSTHQSLTRAKIANQLIQNWIRERKIPNFEVISPKNQAILRNKATNQNLLIVFPEDIVEEIDASSQAKLWGDRLNTSISKAIALRHPWKFWRQLSWMVGLILLTVLLTLRLLQNLTVITTKYRYWVYLFLAIFWTLIIHYSLNLVPQLRNWRYQGLQFLQQTSISGFSLWQILLLLAILFIYSLLLHQLWQIFQPSFSKSQRILLESVIHLVGWVVIAKLWGLELGLIILGLGLLVLAIAYQYSSGFILNLEQPFQVGDLIEIDDLMGKVTTIGLTHTQIITSAQTRVMIPNHRLVSGTFTNWTTSENSPVRLNIPVAVNYGTDLSKVKAALLEAVKNHPDVLHSPRPLVYLHNLSADSLELELLFWIEAIEKQTQIKSELRFRIEASLRRYHIQLSKSQQDIYLQSPQIEQWFKAWLMQQGFNLSHLDKEEISQVELADEEIVVNSWLETLTPEEIIGIIRQMRYLGGLPSTEHRDSFTGSQMVDWLVQNYHCNREEAIAFGKMLLEKGIIHHVSEQHTFLDGPYFYRFSSDK